MDELLARNYGLPVAWRLVEGLSNAMLLGHWWGGGEAWSVLTCVYAVHWAASIRQHMWPCQRHLEADACLILVVAVERVFLLLPSHPLVWVVACLLLCDNPDSTDVCFAKVMLVVALVVACHGSVPAWWVAWFLLGGCCYLASNWWFWASRLYAKSLAHIGFHVCLTCAAYLEVGMRMKPSPGGGVVRLLAYGARVFLLGRQ